MSASRDRPPRGETVTHHRMATVAGRRTAYLDSGGTGPVLLALHGHFGRGRIFEPLAEALADRYRVIAPDQRGHGRTDSAGDFSPEAYADDAVALLDALDVPSAAVLGHSMGGAVAFVLAARAPERVRALLVADMTVLNQEPEAHPVLDCSGWPRRAPSRAALGAAIEAHGIPDAGYFLDSAVEFPDGWGLLFDTRDMMASQRAFAGDLGAHWRASGQPALLMRAEHSFLLSERTARRMAGERPHTELVTFPGCGHWLYRDDPERFARTVAGFLDRALG
ncbi:alpha/beta hydrolase [Streptomyces albus subsp. chlorinus]|uniref:alpha/beta fold hydrolase n=1 Tax=Streptomyces albus TaxID=1888 RepID=UPI0015714C41|nr:alpha/beta hydrolase [Streptomyces albus]NSC20504.1 alpha/beta hydrolase [Streptomyces albus subsp. chlorinus]